MFLSDKRQSFVVSHILLSLKLTACIARATMLLARKMGYDRTRSSFASAGSRKMRRCISKTRVLCTTLDSAGQSHRAHREGSLCTALYSAV
jgi:hypothetical protein